MPRARSVVQVDTTRLNRIIKNLDGNAYDGLRTMAFAVEAEAKVRAAVDTGAMRASIYTRVGKLDTFNTVAAEVRQRNSQLEVTPLPAPDGPLVAIVGPSVHYAVYIEFGTSRMAAQPFLTPAVRKVTSDVSGYFKKATTD